MRETSLEDADIIIFNGGEDIATKIYKELPIYASIPVSPSLRDREEMEIFAKYEGTDKLLVGICRGSQLLNCLNGGSLWQDVNNHGRDHLIVDSLTGSKFIATSTHHQMMRPNYNTAKIIAVADQATRKDAEKDHWILNGLKSFPDAHQDTEIVWYGNTHSLCIQGHPEYVPGSLFADYCLSLIQNHLNEVRNCVV